MPSCVPPSKNATVPVIVPAVLEVTAAVKLTFAPEVDGFCKEVTTVEVADLVEAFTVWVSAVEVLFA